MTPETDQQAVEIANQSALSQLFWKTTKLTLFWLLGFLIATGLVIAVWLLIKFNQFSTASGAGVQYLWQTAKTGWQEPLRQTHGRTTFLVLGLDALASRPGQPILTDTMLLVSFDTTAGKLYTLPLPRDLWHPDFQTKINALYFYGRQQNPEQPQLFVTQAISDLTGLPIDFTLVLTLDQVGEIIENLGGVKIEIPIGFVDPAFPRTDVDVTKETDPAKLYESVEFLPGPQVLSADQALKYIRSRHAAGDQGTDDARAARQQLVIQALVSQLTSSSTLMDFQKLGRLLKTYLTNFDSQLPLTQVMALGKQLWKSQKLNSLTIINRQLPIFPENPAGLIEHPPTTPRQYQGQWVYVLTNPEEFGSELTKLLDWSFAPIK